MIHPVPKPAPRPKKPRARLSRRTPINPRRDRERRSSAQKDAAWLNAVRSLRYCAAARAGATDPCSWWPLPPMRPEADHMGHDHGKGQKCADPLTAPMCHGHHMDRTDGTGWFKGWTQERMRAFCAEAIFPASRLVEDAREKCNCGDLKKPRPWKELRRSRGCQGRLFLCAGCLVYVPWCFGAADNMPDHCDDCWKDDECA